MLNKITERKEAMLSLYDYLGRAAGSKLGKKVADYATIRKQKYQVKNVENPAYQGEIMMYTKEFLDEYFKVEKIFLSKENLTEINTQLTEDSYKQGEQVNLPF
jgi:hypothetical protein